MHRIAPLVGGGDLVARRRADHPPQGHAVALGSGNLILIPDVRNGVGHARRRAGIGAVRLGDVEEELLLIGACLLGKGVVHVAQIERLCIGRRESGIAAEHVADAFANGVHIDRRIHFQQVRAHVHADDDI